MAHQLPHTITNKRLLRFTGQQAELQPGLAKLVGHERAIKALKKAGYKYDPKTGKITPRT